MTQPAADLARHRALLDYAAQCEQKAWEAAPDAVRAAELYEEAIHARLAALALEAQAAA
jgi:hypothetical protein